MRTGTATLLTRRLFRIWDPLTGHHTPARLLGLFAHGVMGLSTPRSGSWLTLAESLPRILKRRARDGQHPQTSEQMIAWLEATARACNAEPPPCTGGGTRAARRVRARERRHALGGSGACSARSFRRRRYGSIQHK